MSATHEMSLDLGVLGEHECTITYSYYKGFAGNREEPPEPEEWEILEIKAAELNHVTGETVWHDLSWLLVDDACFENLCELLRVSLEDNV